MKKNHIIMYIIGVLLSAIMFLPFVWGVVLSFKDNSQIFGDPAGLPSKWDFSKYIDTFQKAHIAMLFKNSFILAIISVMLGMVLIYISSFAISRLNFKYRGMSNFFYYLFLAATSVPIFILMMTIYKNVLFLGKVSNGVMGINSLFGLILPYIAFQIPFSTLMYVGGLKGIPIEMEEAGVIDGSGLFGLMFKIDLPILMPVVVTIFIFQFLAIWNEFPTASILLSSTDKYTIPLAVAFLKDQNSTDYGAAMRAVTMIMLPQMIFYFIFQKNIIEGMATAGIKG
jgi:ABC-type sugar transport system, permease component